MRLPHSVPIFAACLCWAALAPSDASAQDLELTREQQIIAVASIGIISVTTTTSATVQMSTLESEEEEYEEKIKDMEKFVRLQLYLNEGQHELELALSIGGGDGLKDLAALMHVHSEDFASWSKTMRGRRAAIALVLRATPTLERAKAFYHLALTPQLASYTTAMNGRVEQ